MKRWNQTTEQIDAIITTGNHIQIVSGGGGNGTVEDSADREQRLSFHCWGSCGAGENSEVIT